MQKIITIEGMSCGGCSGRVEKLLNAIGGISAKVSHEDGKAFVELAKDIEDAVLINTIEGAGYKVTGIN